MRNAAQRLKALAVHLKTDGEHRLVREAAGSLADHFGVWRRMRRRGYWSRSPQM
jgi:hypothetical protein